VIAERDGPQCHERDKPYAERQRGPPDQAVIFAYENGLV